LTGVRALACCRAHHPSTDPTAATTEHRTLGNPVLGHGRLVVCAELCVSERGPEGWLPLERILPNSSTSFDLAVDGTGRVFLTNTGVVVSRRPARAWQQETLPPDDTWYTASIDATGRGRAAVVFWGPGASSNGETVAKVRRPTGAWTRAHRIYGRHESARAAMADDGTAFISAGQYWTDGDVYVARFVFGEGWKDQVTLDQGTDARVVCGPDGRALLFFRGPGRWLRAAFRPAH